MKCVSFYCALTYGETKCRRFRQAFLIYYVIRASLCFNTSSSCILSGSLPRRSAPRSPAGRHGAPCRLSRKTLSRQVTTCETGARQKGERRRNTRRVVRPPGVLLPGKRETDRTSPPPLLLLLQGVKEPRFKRAIHSSLRKSKRNFALISPWQVILKFWTS